MKLEIFVYSFLCPKYGDGGEGKVLSVASCTRWALTDMHGLFALL